MCIKIFNKYEINFKILSRIKFYIFRNGYEEFADDEKGGLLLETSSTGNHGGSYDFEYDYIIYSPLSAL